MLGVPLDAAAIIQSALRIVCAMSLSGYYGIFVFGTYASHIVVTEILEQIFGDINVISLQNSAIEAVHVKERKEAQEGDVLFTLVAVHGASEGKMLEDTTQRLIRAQLKALYNEVAQWAEITQRIHSQIQLSTDAQATALNKLSEEIPI